MRYILCVRLANFYVRGLTGRAGGRPLVVLRDKQVLDSDSQAAEKGVFPGMSERQARAIVESAAFVPWDSEEHTQAQIEWLDRCTPYTDAIEPSDQHEAFLELSQHPQPHQIAKQLAQTLELPASLGAAGSRWLASLAADFAPPGHLFDHAVTEPADFLKGLPVECLTPVPCEHRERLAFLGYRKIGEIALLPMSVLQSQFGKDALTIRQAALGRLYQPVEPTYPPDSLSESLALEGGANNSQSIDDALGLLAGRLGERLISAERQSRELKLFVEMESGQLLALKRRFNKPIRCRLSALASLRLLLPADLDEPVVRLRALVPALERAPKLQRSLEGRLGDTGRKGEAVEIALKSVRTVFGDQAVVEGRHLNQPRRVLVIREWKESTGWR